MKFPRSMIAFVFAVGISGPSLAYPVVQRAACPDNGVATCAAALPNIAPLALVGLSLVALGLSRRKRSLHIQVG